MTTNFSVHMQPIDETYSNNQSRGPIGGVTREGGGDWSGGASAGGGAAAAGPVVAPQQSAFCR